MRTSKYSEAQIIGFLRQAEAGMPVKEIGRKSGFSDASFYKSPSHLGMSDGFGLGLTIVSRLCEPLGFSFSMQSRPGRGSVFRVEVHAVAPL